MKEKYYKEIKNFITWPSQKFGGVGGNIDIFKSLVEKNSHFLAVVYQKAEDLFEKLEKLLETFKPWTLLGYIDIDTFQNKLETLNDWEFNIKNIRDRR